MGSASLLLLLALHGEPVELPQQTVRVVQPAPVVSTSAVSSREFVADRAVIPGERWVGMELAFLTSPAGLDGRPLLFTDVVISRLDGSASLGTRFKLTASLDLLPKQA
ncbi:MAG TPA: hypothetical protein VN914_16795, partial [Polyangia bacterium]|nr:hypothetical protein [Polyangia bacterium]